MKQGEIKQFGNFLDLKFSFWGNWSELDLDGHSQRDLDQCERKIFSRKRPRISVACLAQGNMSGSNDFTKLKALREELQNYKMSPMWSFGAGKSLFWISSRRICTAISDGTEWILYTKAKFSYGCYANFNKNFLWLFKEVSALFHIIKLNQLP